MTLACTKARIGAVALVLASTIGLAGTASAETWARAHPRRAEVNDRLANQNRRIHREVQEGEISGARAYALQSEDRTIRAEERFMASQHGGHITRVEQRALNQQENGVSRQIGQ
ncbi:MAG TPA: hypothetical protein VEH77_16795 [Roseiarcus sp.]|nr:hypothetical protein [Roseiarcus sp.]